MISAMHDMTVGVFKDIEITSNIDVDTIIKYTERILIVAALKIYRQVLAECKESEKGLAGDQWNLMLLKILTMEQFWDWTKVGTIYRAVDLFTGPERCKYFEKEFLFDLGKSM